MTTIMKFYDCSFYICVRDCDKGNKRNYIKKTNIRGCNSELFVNYMHSIYRSDDFGEFYGIILSGGIYWQQSVSPELLMLSILALYVHLPSVIWFSMSGWPVCVVRLVVWVHFLLGFLCDMYVLQNFSTSCDHSSVLSVY